MRSVQDDLRTAIDDVRQLVSALRPPMLDELGLVSAINACARGFGTGPGVPRFEVTAPELPLLPAAVEVAAYRIACESLTNAVRHAGAQLCTVRLELSEEKLELIVSDDGVGMIPDSSRDGVGLTSMRERAAELGGSTVFSAGDTGRGTTVHATLPRGGSNG
jgi:signal transduction histidine kinase